MQRYNSLTKGQQGFISLSLLLLLIFLAGIAQGLMRLAVSENEAQQKYLQRRQRLKLTSSLLAKAQIALASITTTQQFTLAPVTLHPGQEQVTPKIFLYKPNQGFSRFLEVSFIDSEGILWRAGQTILEPPGGNAHPVYQQGFYSKASNAAIPVPPLETETYSRAAQHELPAYLLLREKGLEGYLYANTRQSSIPKSYEIPPWTTVPGSGVLYQEGDVKLGKGMKATGRLWLLVRGKIYIGDNVKLSNALLFSTEDIYLGRNSSICGIIVAAGKITSGTGFKQVVNKAVLEPFFTPYFNY